MKEDEDFGPQATSDMYPIFHEAVSLPSVRQWLQWDPQEGSFTDEEQLHNFYQLLTSSEDDSYTSEPKITSFSQVRELRNIVPNAEARRVLLDPTRSFIDSVSIAKRDELSRSWFTQVTEAVEAMNSLSARDIENLSEEDLQQIRSVGEAAEYVLNTYKKLVDKA